MVSLNRRGFLGAVTAAGAASAIVPSAQASAPTPPTEEGSDETPLASDHLVIASLSAPVSLDPGLAADMESQRVVRQVLEPLLGIDTNTGAPAPLLAEEWDISQDELTYTFTLREGVIFHDETPLTAETVVANFQRWGELNEIYGERLEHTVVLPFVAVFGGFADEDSCVLDEVEATDEHTVVVHLKEPTAHLLQAMTMPAFGIVSAEVLNASDPLLIESQPVGTGAYQLVPEADGLHFRRFADYWDTEAQGPAEVTIRPITRSFDRLRELQRGRVDIYDGITANNLRSLVQAGRLIMQRDPFSVLYLGFNLDHPVMADKEIREAAAHAVNRPALTRSVFLEGTQSAYQFTPPALTIEAEGIQRYDFDPELASELLNDSDYDGEPLDFFYPITATRTYLPQPEAVYATVAANLTAAGFVLRPRPVVWEDGYLDQLLDDENRAMHILGRNGDYRSPHSFFGSLFGQRSKEFNYDVADVRELLDTARAETDEDERAEIYGQAAEQLAEDLPALPLAFPISALALGQRVTDYPMSPVLNERFVDIQLGQQP